MIAEKIKAIRKSLNITQLELANILDLQVLAISQYERNKNIPGFHVLKNLCVKLNVNPSYLILGKEPIFDTENNEDYLEIEIKPDTPTKIVFKIKE